MRKTQTNKVTQSAARAQQPNKVSPLDVQIGGSHYKDVPIQPVEFIHANSLPFIEGNCIKYLTRHREKGREQDVRKVIHYCQLLLKLEYGVDA